MNVEKDFRAYLQIGLDQTVKRVRHHPFSRVLDGHHAEGRPILGDLLKYLWDARRRPELGRRAEFLFGGQMAVGSCSAEIHNLERRLKRTATGYDLAINGTDRGVGQRPAAQTGEPVNNFLLALRNVNLLVT